jgi:D-sedoheptulose 7-phosphate isomerase
VESIVINYVRSEIAKSVEVFSAMLSDAQLLETVLRVGQMCARTVRAGGKVMFCGNGGSAADCQHLAAELVGKLVFDRPAMAGLALTVDTSALTAVGNDFGYEHVFSRQVDALGRRGDVLIGISTSGRSANVLRALEAARRNDIRTVAMTGRNRGPLVDLADEWIAVPHAETQKIQEGHIVLGHIFCALVEAEIHGRRQAAT